MSMKDIIFSIWGLVIFGSLAITIWKLYRFFNEEV
jgi:hypothetical protein